VWDVNDPAPKLRADAARNRALVLSAARAAISGGDLSLNLNVLAKQAGVGVGTVYRHFGTRHDLLLALTTDRFHELIKLGHDLLDLPDPWEGIERYSRAAITMLTEDPAFAAACDPSDQHDCRPDESIEDELRALTGQLMERAIATGQTRHGIVTDDLHYLLGAVIHAAYRAPNDRNKTADRYLAVTLAGLRR
jgi:AcrR family transcriptional regulator